MLAAIGVIRAVYVVEAVAVVTMLVVLALRPLPDGRQAVIDSEGEDSPSTSGSGNGL